MKRLRWIASAHLLALAVIFSSGHGALMMTMLSQDTEGKICFEVQNWTTGETSLPPKLALVLQVRYPSSLAEAGQLILEGKDLSLGNHNLSYKHLATNMTHDLAVWLDGKKKRFVKEDSPRWYSVSRFQAVVLLLQGGISIHPCLHGGRMGAVAGQRGEVPCGVDPLQVGNQLLSVLWYKGPMDTPVYRYNGQHDNSSSETHWANETLFGNRAYFDSEVRPPALFLDPVLPQDEGFYTCTFHYLDSPTSSSSTHMSVLMYPDDPPEIIWNGKRVLDSVGPLKEGSTHKVTCWTRGGRPFPSLEWRLDGQWVANQVQEKGTDGEVMSVLTIRASGNNDRGFLTCSAKIFWEGEPIGQPLTTSVRLHTLYQDMTVSTNSALKGSEIPIRSRSGDDFFLKEETSVDHDSRFEGVSLASPAKPPNSIRKLNASKNAFPNSSLQQLIDDESLVLALPSTSSEEIQTKTTSVLSTIIAIPNATFLAPMHKEEEPPSSGKKVLSFPTNHPTSPDYPNFGETRNGSALACADGDCSESHGHDYTIVLTLVGILGGLFAIASIISLVFYRKKKKLMASTRAKPQNRLRHQIEEEMMADAESPLVLKDLATSREDIP